MYKCEKCGFECMSESLHKQHVERCTVLQVSEYEQKKLIRKKQYEDRLKAKEDSLYGN